MNKEIIQDKNKDIIEEKNTKENKFRKIFTIENLLCFLIIICPILDILSFIFRNYFHTSFSVSTFVRPIIPIIAFTYIFFKEKLKKPITISVIFYVIYAICHLYIFSKLRTGCSYGNVLREIQYLVNYTFMIMNLFIYSYFFAVKNRQKEIKDKDKKKAINKLKKSVLISLTLYISFMYIALITKTSSFTYMEEKIGYKGWFESGNSIGTIMLLSLFIVLPMLGKENKQSIRIWTLMVVVLVGAYLTTLLGTRTGLFGFIIVLFTYAVISIMRNLIVNKKINKKTLITLITAFMIIGVVVIIFGSRTIERRKNLANKESEIYDDMQNKTAHVTGDIVNLVKRIKEGTLDTNYMSEDAQQSMLDLYNIANEKEISNTNMRALQFIYHSRLIKNQDSFPILLFGNGYMTHFYEMTFEMEVPAFLYNFGIVGFFLYFMPFLVVALYGIYIAIRKLKDMSTETIMHILGLWFAIVVSFLSGYTFFNSSTMMIIIVLTILIVNDLKDIEDNEIKIYNGKESL